MTCNESWHEPKLPKAHVCPLGWTIKAIKYAAAADAADANDDAPLPLASCRCVVAWWLLSQPVKASQDVYSNFSNNFQLYQMTTFFMRCEICYRRFLPVLPKLDSQYNLALSLNMYLSACALICAICASFHAREHEQHESPSRAPFARRHKVTRYKQR